ncbi:peptidase inhibitor family I36 protein [Streptomyces sp. ActVer]|uniref:peptidase inhibitor family I36 protein n=1 Tax=Streptomyces sp. ActVer TaxID=3014558 RepID=UPI0022B322AC|nr:peptidase inhibitor family I36 protein [Streptomyces sp. ActVer]MCZ4509105.1 peptidase inhibitor family I36 protein [Streptomyces sp. ActVer]
MKRKLGVAIGIAALCAGGAIGMTGTASAAETGAQATYFVLYEDDSYGGRHANFSGSDVELNNKYWVGSTSAFAQNGGSSMRNNTGSNVGLWDVGTSCTGASYTARANTVDSDFSNNNFDNKASCVRFL